MARLYSNENFPFPVVEVLRTLGHDVVTIQECGKGNVEVSDPEVLAVAHKLVRAIAAMLRSGENWRESVIAPGLEEESKIDEPIIENESIIEDESSIEDELEIDDESKNK